jgi:hypothetical protein
MKEREVAIMYKIRILSVLVSVLLSGGAAEATLIYEDWLIHEGDDYDIVSVLNDATLGMTGGEVRRLYTNHASTLNFFDGTVSWLTASDTSTMYIYGGLTEHALILERESTVNLFGGTIGERVRIYDSGRVNIYGYGFEFLADGGTGGISGLLSGYWLDHTPFTIRFEDLSEPFPGTQIQLIPEPSVFLLLCFGALILKWRNR